MRRSWVLLPVLALATAFGCASPAGDTAEEPTSSGAIQASPETTRAIGVSSWKLDQGDGTMSLYGLDAGGQVRTAWRFGTTKDADGNTILVLGTTDGRILIKVVSKDQYVVLENTIGSRAEIAKILERLQADISEAIAENQSGPSLTKSSLRPLDEGDPLQLVVPTDCTNSGLITAGGCVATASAVLATGIVCFVTAGFGCPAMAAGMTAVGVVPAGNCAAGLTCAAQGR